MIFHQVGYLVGNRDYWFAKSKFNIDKIYCNNKATLFRKPCIKNLKMIFYNLSINKSSFENNLAGKMTKNVWFSAADKKKCPVSTLMVFRYWSFSLYSTDALVWGPDLVYDENVVRHDENGVDYAYIITGPFDASKELNKKLKAKAQSLG